MTNEKIAILLDECVPKHPKSDWGRWQRNVVDKAIAALENRPEGEWRISHTDIDEAWIICSECNAEISAELDDTYQPILYSFCPNCGADMRGKAE